MVVGLWLVVVLCMLSGWFWAVVFVVGLVWWLFGGFVDACFLGCFVIV